jgi:hypothetical protein
MAAQSVLETGSSIVTVAFSPERVIWLLLAMENSMPLIMNQVPMMPPVIWSAS